MVTELDNLLELLNSDSDKDINFGVAIYHNNREKFPTLEIAMSENPKWERMFGLNPYYMRDTYGDHFNVSSNVGGFKFLMKTYRLYI